MIFFRMAGMRHYE